MSFSRYLQGWRKINDSVYFRLQSVISNLPDYSISVEPIAKDMPSSGYELRKKQRNGKIQIELATIGPSLKLFTESVHLVQKVERVTLPRQELSSLF